MRAAIACVLIAGSLNAEARAQTEAESAFAHWRAAFMERARAQGRQEETLQRLFLDVAPDERVLQFDRRRSAFTPPMWTYLDARVSPARIARGRALLVEHAALLSDLHAAYGVPGEVLVSVWAMESRFGEATLDYDPRQSLATLAFAGRRKAYFDNELMALAHLMEQDLLPQMTSSWDGGLGQPQFMPSNFVDYAADGDGDGVRDIWTNTADVLASIAQYLRLHGWQSGEPLFIEVLAPAELAPSEAREYRSLRDWETIGVRRIDGRPSDEHLSLRLLRPDGLLGPALLTTRNYDVLMRYNGGPRYGVAAALLAHAIADHPPLQTPWPRPADAMTADELLTAQRILAALGYDVGEADGVYGERSWLALNAFAGERGSAQASYPRRDVYEALVDLEIPTPAAP